MSPNPNSTPGIGTTITATPRKILAGPEGAVYLPGGKIIAGAHSRDPANTADIDVLRAGMVLGKRSNDNKYAPSILGLLTVAATPAGADITVPALAGDEINRRIVAGGLFKVVGPPAADVMEVQTITIGALLTGGVFRVGYKGELTADIAFNETQTNINVAVALLATVVADGGLTLAAGDEPDADTVGVWTFTTAGPRDAIFYDLGDATCATPTVVNVKTTLGESISVVKESRAVSFSAEAAGVVTLAANSAVAEVQTSTLDTVMTAGTFTMTYKGFTTAAIDFDATVAEIQAALLLLPSINPDDVVMQAVHEPSTEAACTWTFATTLGNVPMLSMDISNATGPTTIAWAETTPGEIVAYATLAANFAVGSMVMPLDGSEDPFTLLVEEYGLKVTDDDNVTNLDILFARLLIGGIIDASQIVNYPHELTTQRWLKDQLNANQQGRFTFDDDF